MNSMSYITAFDCKNETLSNLTSKEHAQINKTLGMAIRDLTAITFLIKCTRENFDGNMYTEDLPIISGHSDH